jgi:ribonuclease G
VVRRLVRAGGGIAPGSARGRDRPPRSDTLQVARSAFPGIASGGEGSGQYEGILPLRVSDNVPTEIIVNVNPRETRVAILDDGKLSEIMYEREGSVVGNIYLGRVENVVPALDAAFVTCGIERNVFLHVSDAMEEEPTRQQMRHKMNGFPPIKEVVKNGDTFLVQVTKGPVELKGARATRRISLPGRHLVLTHDGRGRVGVSKKIDDEAERTRLRDLAQSVKPEGFGVIVRTRAEGAQRKEFEDDVKFLTKLWRSIEGKARQAKAPALIHEDLSLVFEVVRDVLAVSTARFVVDDKVTYDKVLNVVDNVEPRLRKRVELYKGDQPIFTAFGVEQQIDRALQPKVWLPHGGHIHIAQTEALTTIDVNTGKFTGAAKLEETVLRTNLDAADEIAKQLRLRDIGGIIVIDFIDMDKRKHRDQVLVALRNAFKDDRMRTRIMHITRLGLVEMTRKRTEESLQQKLTTHCPCCNGLGLILSPETMACRIAEELRVKAAHKEAEAYVVVANPRVCLSLIGPHGDDVAVLEEEIGVQVYIRCDTGIHPENYEITPGAVKDIEKQHPVFKVGRRLTIQPEQFLPAGGEGLVAQIDGYLVEVPEISDQHEGPVKARVTAAGRSYVRATPMGTKSK